mmetsp:Transcript_31537/g.91209  ORF Transcript_31537/g.91209 Transcript_31537/m.91209 type:complete len:327 (-) Transcript_31537:1358-2338(-)
MPPPELAPNMPPMLAALLIAAPLLAALALVEPLAAATPKSPPDEAVDIAPKRLPPEDSAAAPNMLLPDAADAPNKLPPEEAAAPNMLPPLEVPVALELLLPPLEAPNRLLALPVAPNIDVLLVGVDSPRVGVLNNAPRSAFSPSPRPPSMPKLAAVASLDAGDAAAAFRLPEFLVFTGNPAGGGIAVLSVPNPGTLPELMPRAAAALAAASPRQPNVGVSISDAGRSPAISRMLRSKARWSDRFTLRRGCEDAKLFNWAYSEARKRSDGDSHPSAAAAAAAAESPHLAERRSWSLIPGDASASACCARAESAAALSASSCVRWLSC